MAHRTPREVFERYLDGYDDATEQEYWREIERLRDLPSPPRPDGSIARPSSLLTEGRSPGPGHVSRRTSQQDSVVPAIRFSPNLPPTAADEKDGDEIVLARPRGPTKRTSQSPVKRAPAATKK